MLERKAKGHSSASVIHRAANYNDERLRLAGADFSTDLCSTDLCPVVWPEKKLGRLKTRERTTRDQVAGMDNTRTFWIDHSDKFRSHFASVLVYCYLIFFNASIDKVQQKSMQSQLPHLWRSRVVISRVFSVPKNFREGRGRRRQRETVYCE